MEAFARRVGWCLLAYAAVAWVPWVTTEYHTRVFTISLYYVVLAVDWNLLAGYTGQFSLAHHTFAGGGAYTSALPVQHTRLPMLVGIVAGAGLASGLGYVLVSLCLRLRAIYLPQATWAFCRSIRLLFLLNDPIPL